MSGPQTSDALVIFGITGDLAYKQIFPALHALIRRGHLDAPILGMARADSSIDELRARARASIEEKGDLDDAAFEKLSSLLQFIGGNYEDASTFDMLRTALDGTRRPAFYFAIPPSLFG
ncbi:MAG: glucose-6-phosphate dehydrogenase, partial [Acidobacteria bacterium]|nr:glucose-6-phosphate dehydrogenase [Acidobacteriota bacterium]